MPPAHDPPDQRLAPPGCDPLPAMSARWHLAVVGGPDPGWCLAVDRLPRTIGRDPACDLPLEDPALSRRHAEVRERRGRVEVRDLGSANGTRVRGSLPVPRPVRLVHARARVARWRRLKPGHTLVVGSSRIQVRARPGLAAPVPSGRRVLRRVRPVAARFAPVAIVLAVSIPLLLLAGVSGGRLLAFLALPLLLGLVSRRGRPPFASGLPSTGSTDAAGRGGARGRRWSASLSSADPRAPADSRAPADPYGPGDPRARGLLAVQPPKLDPAALLLSTGLEPGDATSRAAPWQVEVPGLGTLDELASAATAFVGAAADVAAAARWVVCGAAATRPAGALDVAVDPALAAADWTWVRALPQASAATRSSGRALKLDVVRAGRSAGARARGAGAVLVLARGLGEVPPWCERVVEVSPDGWHLVTARWAHRLASRLSPAAAGGQDEAPRSVPLGPLLPDPEVSWSAHDGRLAAVFLVDRHGPVPIDLVTDGPHALVAGTTGSGKSELLQSWVLALASRYPPCALSLVAVDYKGGATFGPLAHLPHTAGVLTDLDGSATVRALAGLRVEILRRERLLAEAGVPDIEALAASRQQAQPGRSATLGRLLVVVDEFRVLADSHPELMADLVRIAAQGRSLGIHLVLATQRPAGALSADVRANLGVAICLRVLTGADSQDVVGSVAASALPPIPGRALLRGASAREGGPGDAACAVQTAWSGAQDEVADQVARICAAAERLDLARAPALWADPLPMHASLDADLIDPASSASRDLPMLLTDRVAERRLVPWSWRPDLSPVLVVAGGRGSGRTTAIRTVARAALERSVVVHVIHGSRPGEDREAWAEHPGLGTVVGTDDPRRIVRLLDVLPSSTAAASILCIDDVDALLAASELIPGRSGVERLGRLLGGTGPSLGVVIAGPVEILAARWAAAARHRVVLGALDSHLAALAGVPRWAAPALAPPRPGRPPRRCGAAGLPGPRPGTGHDVRPGRVARGGGRRGWFRWRPPAPARDPRGRVGPRVAERGQSAGRPLVPGGRGCPTRPLRPAGRGPAEGPPTAAGRGSADRYADRW